jgi:hypothetical protein
MKVGDIVRVCDSSGAMEVACGKLIPGHPAMTAILHERWKVISIGGKFPSATFDNGNYRRGPFDNDTMLMQPGSGRICFTQQQFCSVRVTSDSIIVKDGIVIVPKGTKEFKVMVQ